MVDARLPMKRLLEDFVLRLAPLVLANPRTTEPCPDAKGVDVRIADDVFFRSFADISRDIVQPAAQIVAMNLGGCILSAVPPPGDGGFTTVMGGIAARADALFDHKTQTWYVGFTVACALGD